MLLTITGLLLLALCGLVAARSRLQLAAIAVVLGAGCLLSLAYGISDHFTGEGITYAVLAHFNYGVHRGELGVLRFPALLALVLCVAAAYLLWLWAAASRVRRGNRRPVPARIGWCLVLAGLVLLPLHPAVADLHALQRQLAVSDDVLTGQLRWSVDPAAARPPRSIVYLYLESYERSFLDESLFPGVAPRLRALEGEGLSIHGIATAPLMNWTIAGMVASQCGMVMAELPGGDTSGGYRPGVHCLGDVMRDTGYRLSYVGGADLGFSGKGRYYRAHGFHTVIGLDELDAEIGGFPRSEWGAYDDIVFARARQEFDRLRSGEDPFALFVLTTATHPHDGYPSPGCDTGGFENPMLASAHCSDGQAVEFVRWLQEHAPDDLLIVVASDHLQVAGKASQLLKRKAKRDNLFLVLGRDIEPQVIERTATTLDVAPTVASLLGLGITEMGLGRSLLLPAPTLAEQYGLARFNSMIPGWRTGLDPQAGMASR